MKLSSTIEGEYSEEEEDEIVSALCSQHGKLLDKKRDLEAQRALLLGQPESAAFTERMLAYRQVLEELRANTSKALTQEVKRELIKVFTKKVYLDLPAPRIFRLIIDWRDESWGVTEMICLRERGQAPSWSDEENELLR